MNLTIGSVHRIIKSQKNRSSHSQGRVGAQGSDHIENKREIPIQTPGEASNCDETVADTMYEIGIESLSAGRKRKLFIDSGEAVVDPMYGIGTESLSAGRKRKLISEFDERVVDTTYGIGRESPNAGRSHLSAVDNCHTEERQIFCTQLCILTCTVWH